VIIVKKSFLIVIFTLFNIYFFSSCCILKILAEEEIPQINSEEKVEELQDEPQNEPEISEKKPQELEPEQNIESPNDDSDEDLEQEEEQIREPSEEVEKEIPDEKAHIEKEEVKKEEANKEEKNKQNISSGAENAEIKDIRPSKNINYDLESEKVSEENEKNSLPNVDDSEILEPKGYIDLERSEETKNINFILGIIFWIIILLIITLLANMVFKKRHRKIFHGHYYINKLYKNSNKYII
jgi:hypothetical protein